MKRICCILLSVMLLLGLSGCFLEPAEGLYAVPQQPEEYYNLQSAIDEVMPEGATYASPASGENQQSVQLADLDGDGSDEAIVFLKTAGDYPLAMYVFDEKADKFSLLSKAEGSGSAFDRVIYVQIDDVPGYEIVLGRQLSGEVMQMLTVYTVHDGVLTELASANYSQFIISDLNADGMQDVFLLRSDESASMAIAELYCWKDGQLAREREARGSASTAAIKRIITGYMCTGVPAVFVASEYGEGDIITDIFGFRKGVFANLATSEEADTSVQTVRDYYVYSSDLDGDGLIELPRLIDLPFLPGDDNSKDQSLIRWYNLQTDGMEVSKRLTYHNYSGGWYLEIPEELASDLIVTRGEQIGNSIGYRFVLRRDNKIQLLFTIATLTGENINTLARSAGWTTLAQKGDALYVCKLGEAAEENGLDYDTLKALFHFIHFDWNTGETK